MGDSDGLDHHAVTVVPTSATIVTDRLIQPADEDPELRDRDTVIHRVYAWVT